MWGDLNSNAKWEVWERWWIHSDVINDLEKLGIVSVYHLRLNEQQGKESHPIFYMQHNLDKHYPIDYLFASQSLFAQEYSKTELFQKKTGWNTVIIFYSSLN